VPWSKAENAAVERHFGSYFLTLERPVLVHFKAFMAAEKDAMTRRTLKNVRDQVQTRITKLRRQQQNNTGD
jgi:hypothetical protein